VCNLAHPSAPSASIARTTVPEIDEDPKNPTIYLVPSLFKQRIATRIVAKKLRIVADSLLRVNESASYPAISYQLSAISYQLSAKARILGMLPSPK
jgi:hypothetical protein